MAIDDLLDEHEQEQRVRDWLKRNALNVVTGVVVGLGLIWGWQNWQQSSLAGSAADYARYQSVVAELASSDLETAAAQVAALEAESDGVYVTLAALELTKAQVAAGKMDEAITTLRALKAEGEFQALINQRIARLLIASGKADEALATLGTAADAASEEIRGDAALATGDVATAREAYARAIVLIDEAAPQRRLVEIKLSDAGGEPPTAADAT